ncbi:hypothetical protein CEXT_237811 [Caerostris extrusa]|uniref:Uncharacterized protein n=1 Tax=Caerostris extrusa TaxID=172846 RepID=A0AAV4UZ41_CAEEX|nr:hypothetical protein CEXT_237811 [Caerostris extrusa]
MHTISSGSVLQPLPYAQNSPIFANEKTRLGDVFQCQLITTGAQFVSGFNYRYSPCAALKPIIEQSSIFSAAIRRCIHLGAVVTQGTLDPSPTGGRERDAHQRIISKTRLIIMVGNLGTASENLLASAAAPEIGAPDVIECFDLISA